MWRINLIFFKIKLRWIHKYALFTLILSAYRHTYISSQFQFFDQSIHMLNDSDGTREVHSIKSLFKHVSKGKKITAIAVCREYPLLYLTKQTDI